MESRYYIIRQSDGYKRYSSTLSGIAYYLDVTIPFLKLHLDKDVPLNGWLVKTVPDEL